MCVLLDAPTTTLSGSYMFANGDKYGEFQNMYIYSYIPTLVEAYMCYTTIIALCVMCWN